MEKNCSNFRFRMYENVKHRTHTKDHDGHYGTIIAREWYECGSGAGEYYYVRWISPHGDVSKESTRHHSDELRSYDSDDTKGTP